MQQLFSWEGNHAWWKSNHANDNNLLLAERTDVTRANAVSERKKSFRTFYFQLCCVIKGKNDEKRTDDDKTKNTTNTAIELRSAIDIEAIQEKTPFLRLSPQYFMLPQLQIICHYIVKHAMALIAITLFRIDRIEEM